MKKVLAGLALVALVVVGYFVLRKPEDDTKPPPPPVAKTTEDPAPKQPTQKSSPRTGEIDGPQQRVMIDDDPKGDERLEGQVVDGDDKPVGGATVTLSSNPPRTTKSGDDGAFAFDQLVARPYTLVARAKDGVAGPVTARLTKKSDPVILKLHAGPKVVVTVVGGDQKPIDKATVELRGLEDRREETANGVATFTNTLPGGYQVAAWSGGMAKAFQWVGVGAGDEEVRIVLAPGAKVAGKVVDESGAAVAGAHVRFSGASDWNQQGNPRYDDATSAADGKFEFAALPAGSFRFVATTAELAPGTSALVTLDGKTPVDNITITMPKGATIKGKVVDQQKQPVASARVRVGPGASTRGMVWEAPRQAYSDAQGAFELKGLPRKQLAAVAMHESGASEAVEADTTNGDAEITLVIDVTGTIAGVVVDPSGTPLEGVQVSAGPDFKPGSTQPDFSQWRLRGFPEELTDSAGKFTLTGLAKGSYTVSASPAKSAGRGGMGRFMGPNPNAVSANTGDTSLKIVLPPEGGLKGTVKFADGSVPKLYTVSVGNLSQSYGTAEFTLEDLAPRKYDVTIRGTGFQTRIVEATVESGKVTDIGSVDVVAGRTIGGVVTADGNPIAGATVHVGRLVFGNGSTSNANFGPMGAGTKHDTTDDQGKFNIAGFPAGDITIVAEHDAYGRSKPLRLPTTLPGQTELNLVLEKFGSLSGVLQQGGKPVEGFFVSCQSTTTPNAIYGVSSGPDGSYKFDKLAPDTYKLSAMIGMPMIGMKFYSKEVVVPSGKEIKADLVVDPGTVELAVQPVSAKGGKLSGGEMRITSGVVVARTYSEMQLKFAQTGTSTAQVGISIQGAPVTFSELKPGVYTVCEVPLPIEIRGMQAALAYQEQHSDALLAWCKQVTVQAAPAKQTTQLPVEVPALEGDAGSGSGSGSGSAHP